MNFVTKSLRIASYHFRHVTATVRIPLILVMVALYMKESLGGVVLFSTAVGMKASPFAFPFLVNDYVVQMIMMAGAIILFCDAPFEENEYPYMLPRAGRLSWASGQVLYILGLSLAYALFLLLSSILPLLGHLELGNEWGKIWGTLAKTDAGRDFDVILYMTEYLVVQFKPLSALFISFVFEWACVSWLGLLIYFLNKLTNKAIGTFTGAFCVLLDVSIANGWAPWANRFSPITLAQIKTYSGYNLRYGITFSYGIGFFVIGIPALVLLCILAHYKERGMRWVCHHEKKKVHQMPKETVHE